MSLFERLNGFADSRRASRQEPSPETPLTLRAELGNPQLDRPIVFDPALKQFVRAHRAGEPRFRAEEEHSRWHSIRATVLRHLVTSVANSPWRQHLLLRGSAVMASWFGDRARRPEDLDWVVMPATVKLHQEEAEQWIAGVIGLFDGAIVNDEIVIPPQAFVIEAIWTYEKAPGVRIIVPWKLLWLTSDMYAMGKDLYDAVLLAEEIHISAETLRATFLTDPHYGPMFLKRLRRQEILKLRVEWNDFIKEYPGIGGTAEQWSQRLVDALEPLFAELEAAPA